MTPSPQDKPNQRVDERDTIFARMERRRGTEIYADYYARRPELKSIDDRLRSMPPLLEPRGRHYDAAIAAETARTFERIETMAPDPEIVTTWAKRLEQASDSTRVVKAMLQDLGAVATGCTAVDPAFVYSHKGRFDACYGDVVEVPHRNALVFLVEMDYASMRQAPLAETLLESARKYYEAARISMTAAAALQEAGHEAKAHYDAHYDVLLVPLAVAAGLGELGRNNILVADRYGSRVRLGAVTTDLDLRHDAPITLGVDRFCQHCRKCAENCPANALVLEGKETIRGVEKWPTHLERCHAWWRQIGTDCGICMATCPFSHKNNAFHGTVRWVLKHAPWMGPVLKWSDDLLYGRRWRPARRRRT